MEVIQQVYQQLVAEFGDLDGYCVEASIYMYRKLCERGIKATVVRRTMGEDGGHWTIRVGGVEYDPTINWWTGGKELYVVDKKSPHRKWHCTATTDGSFYLKRFVKEFSIES